MTDILDDEELAPPSKPDFRRVGKGVPYVVGLDGKRTRYGRPSNAGKVLDDESNLTDWKLRTTVYGAAQRPDLMAQLSTLSPQTDKNTIRDIAEACLVSGKGKERAVKGEAIHAMFDHLDNQDDWQPAPQWLDLCNSYLATLETWGLVPIDVEVHCVNDPRRLAGKLDRRYRTTKVLVAPDNSTVPIGSAVVGDTKTGAVLEYASGSYATQMAAYADSVRYNVETDERSDFNPPTFPDWGLIIHADSAGTEVNIYWVDLNAGREGLDLARNVKGWRQRSDLLTLAQPVAATTAAPVAPVAPQVPQEGARVASLLEHTRGRVRAILGHSEIAAKALQRNWPMGVPGLKAGGHSLNQLYDLIITIEQVEKDYAIPFYPEWQDPENPRDRHPSNWSDKWAKPNRNDPPTKEAVQSIQEVIDDHPRKELLREWISRAVEGGINHDFNTYALANALLEFASVDTTQWQMDCSDSEALTMFLEGTLRKLGYKKGLFDLGRINPEHAPAIMSAAFSITAGTAALVYGEDGHPILRTNIVKG